ncbi:MAG: type II secretion system F family protein [Candidatus Paceibacterota bacterium]
MLFKYQALDSDGNRKDGNVDAKNRDAAINALQRRDLVITSIKGVDNDGETKSVLQTEIKWLERVTSKEVVVLSRQMATLFNAQVSALRVFQLLGEEVENPKLRRIMGMITDSLQAGSTISDALAKHPDVFSAFYVNMVKAGEESGRLDEIFTHLADHLDRMYEINTKTRNALVYPAFVVVVFIAVMALMFTVIIPQISVVLEDVGQELPIYTKIVLGVSAFFASYWFLLIVVAVIVGVIGWKYAHTENGKIRIDRLVLGTPYIGDLVQKLILARIADNLNTMLISGIPMVRALEITKDIIRNDVYDKIIVDAIEDVRGGSALSASFSQYEEMPGIMVQMIKVGEETGELGSLLATLSKFYEREVNNAVDNMVSMIEPIMILFLGLGVGVLLAAVLMPIYNLASGF